VERDCECVLKRIAMWQEEPETLAFITRERPYIRTRFERLATMSREELLEEIESDYVLLRGCNAEH
jgi:hypothetical protein